VPGESAGTGRLVFVNGYCRSASASICAITSGRLIRIHSMAVALMKLDRLILCSRGELLSVFSFSAIRKRAYLRRLALSLLQNNFVPAQGQ